MANDDAGCRPAELDQSKVGAIKRSTWIKAYDFSAVSVGGHVRVEYGPDVTSGFDPPPLFGEPSFRCEHATLDDDLCVKLERSGFHIGSTLPVVVVYLKTSSDAAGCR